MADPPPFVGIDWSSGSWLAVGYDATGPTDVTVADDIRACWDRYAETADRIVIDVPIGLRGPATAPDADETSFVDHDGTRDCDALARDAVGARSSSVFPVPSRPVIERYKRTDSDGESPDWERVNELNKAAIGKGLPQQSAAIAPGIAEVDALLDGPADHETLIEGHPEVAFRALARETLEHSKHSALGVQERARALRNAPAYEPGDWSRGRDAR